MDGRQGPGYWYSASADEAHDASEGSAFRESCKPMINGRNVQD